MTIYSSTNVLKCEYACKYMSLISKQKQLDCILELLNNIDINDIKTSIFQKRTIFDAIQLLTKNEYSLYACKLLKGDKEIGKHGDFILGYYSDVPISFEVNQGDHYKEIIQLKNGEFKYAVNQSYPFLLISASWSEFRIKEKDIDISNVYVIYGLLQKPARLFLAQTNGMTFSLDTQSDDNASTKTYMYYRGHIGTFRPDDSLHLSFDQLPMRKLNVYHPAVKEMIKKSKEKNMVFLKELMEYTWHPKRFMAWCVPYNEQLM